MIFFHDSIYSFYVVKFARFLPNIMILVGCRTGVKNSYILLDNFSFSLGKIKLVDGFEGTVSDCAFIDAHIT